MNEPDPRQERYCHADAPRAMAEAVDALCQQSGRTTAEMDHLTLQEIFDLVVEQYGRDHLPDFWISWNDWHENWGDGDMGDDPEA